MPEATVLVETKRIRQCVFFQPEQLTREQPTAEQPRRGGPPQRPDRHQPTRVHAERPGRGRVTKHLLDTLTLARPQRRSMARGRRQSADPWRYGATNENVA